MSCPAHLIHFDDCADCNKAVPFAALQMLAADNARMCEIVIAADKLVELLEWLDRGGGLGLITHQRIRYALDAFRIVRNGN